MAQMIKVGCKLPSGVILHYKGKDVLLNGANTDPAAQSPLGVVLTTDFVGVTDVDKEFMDAWLKKHAKNPLVTNGIVFIVKDKDSLKAQTKDAGKTGLEGQKQGGEGTGVKTREDDE